MPYSLGRCAFYNIKLFNKAFPTYFVLAHYPSYILKISLLGALLSALFIHRIFQAEQRFSSIKPIHLFTLSMRKSL